MWDHDAVAAMRDQQRLIFRCVTEFLLDEVGRLTRRHGGDFVRAAMLLAVVQASHGPTGEGVDPDRPRGVSVRSLAISLAQPFETTRRKTAALEADGLLRRVKGAGLVATEEAVGGAAYHAECAVARAALVKLLADLSSLGVELSRVSGPLREHPPRSETEIAAIVRLHVDTFLLRSIEYGVTVWGSMLVNVLVAAMVTLNAGVVTHDPDLARRYAGAATPPPDILRRAVTVTDMGDRLGMSYDVVQRRVKRFVAEGWAERVRGGYLFSMEKQQKPQVLDTGLRVVQRFIQMLQALRAAGIDPAAAPAEGT